MYRLLIAIIFTIVCCSNTKLVFALSNVPCSTIQNKWIKYISHRQSIPRTHDNKLCRSLSINGSDSCCTDEILTNMEDASEHEVRKLLQILLVKTAEDFYNDTIGLKSFVTDTLGSIMEQMHSKMRNYFSEKFKSHELLFIDFFSVIHSYLSGNINDLSRIMSEIFEELLRKITQIFVNSNSTHSYTKCVADTLSSKNPFLQIPSIVINMTMEAFPPVRLAINSMAFARETLLDASIDTQPSRECFDEYQRLRFCNLCAGIVEVHRCESSCNRLAQKCTPQLLALGFQWKKFIGAMQQVLDLLERFPKVHRPLQVHLTDAIMNLKSAYTRHEQEILDKCSYLDPNRFTGTNFPSYQAGSRVRRQASEEELQYYQPPPPSSQHSFEAKPLPLIDLGQERILTLQTWVRDVKQRYDRVSRLFDDLGSRFCNSFSESDSHHEITCWSGTSLKPISSKRSPPRLNSIPTPTDSTLGLKVVRDLQKATSNLQRVCQAPQDDPDILRLADPAAITLRSGRNQVSVSSDEEALRSYLDPTLSNLNGDSLDSPEFGRHPWNDPSSSPESFVSDTEQGSGFDNGAPLPYDDTPPGYTDGEESVHPSVSGLPHDPTLPPHSYIPDDEDSESRIENSGYVQPDVYEYPGPLRPGVDTPKWPSQSQSAFETDLDVLPPVSWDKEPVASEGSGADIYRPHWRDDKPAPDWTGVSHQSPLQIGGDSNLVVTDAKLDIPAQIWIPEGDGVVHMYVPPYLQTTSGSSTTFAFPVIIWTAVAFVVLGR